MDKEEIQAIAYRQLEAETIAALASLIDTKVSVAYADAKYTEITVALADKAGMTYVNEQIAPAIQAAVGEDVDLESAYQLST